MRRTATLIVVFGLVVSCVVLAASRGTANTLTRILRQQVRACCAETVYQAERYMDRWRLEGRPAPPLDGISLAALKGRPVLLFFWAHWCPACKADAPVISAIERRFASQGLAVIGPTRLYGYVAGGDPATPEAETLYIEQTRRQYYASLEDMPAPVSAANWEAYRTSTTPTIVLLDRFGVVRFYHPGYVTEQELLAQIQAVVR